MKIAISATGPEKDAAVDPRFGRCAWFQIYDENGELLEAMDNAAASSGGGAGIKAAQEVAGRGVGAVLTGNCGPNAFAVFNAANIAVVTGVSGSVADAVKRYQSGDLAAAGAPSVEQHHGMS